MNKSKVLVLGAGGIGGYFGGRLAEAGQDVTFLVREARQQRLTQNGLTIKSQFGDANIAVNTVTATQLKAHYDFIILACKSYDLESAISSIAPAVGPSTAIIPLLNGVAHIEQLNARFGQDKVLGGSAKIQVTMSEQGDILHLNDWCDLTVGEQAAEITPRVTQFTQLFAQAKGVQISGVNDMMQQMWQKLVHLSTAAAMTCLMRANVGEIVRTPEGKQQFLQLLETNAQIASQNGYRPSDSFIKTYQAIFSDPNSKYATSMLRDIERKNRIEADHIIGFMLNKSILANIESPTLHLAYTHLKAYEQRLLAEQSA
ncbi:ketopantoate reductase [Orbus hercynius]|uniref:2-dehydropantoate 2-reductase n=1 Tax=Orbus hercynius TaxID=593135 RepID=A0A495RC16_9GAMM|nr:ketopantoate reductase family protein [Orbus hercynius]RKS84816.1 ketopantoate reductase [Orbus hercynius]